MGITKLYVNYSKSPSMPVFNSDKKGHLWTISVSTLGVGEPLVGKTKVSYGSYFRKCYQENIIPIQYHPESLKALNLIFSLNLIYTLVLCQSNLKFYIPSVSIG